MDLPSCQKMASNSKQLLSVLEYESIYVRIYKNFVYLSAI